MRHSARGPGRACRAHAGPARARHARAGPAPGVWSTWRRNPAPRTPRTARWRGRPVRWRGAPWRRGAGAAAPGAGRRAPGAHRVQPPPPPEARRARGQRGGGPPAARSSWRRSRRDGRRGRAGACPAPAQWGRHALRAPHDGPRPTPQTVQPPHRGRHDPRGCPWGTGVTGGRPATHPSRGRRGCSPLSVAASGGCPCRAHLRARRATPCWTLRRSGLPCQGSPACGTQRRRLR